MADENEEIIKPKVKAALINGTPIQRIYKQWRAIEALLPYIREKQNECPGARKAIQEWDKLRDKDCEIHLEIKF